MRSEMRTTRVIVRAAGTLSDGRRLHLPVHFDLIETQDFHDGLPGLTFSYGNLELDEAPAELLSGGLRRIPHLYLVGSNAALEIHMHSAESFTVVRFIGAQPYMHLSSVAAA